MTLKSSIDGILTRVTSGAQKDRVPGVVAMITVRKGNIYEGAAGETVLGSGNAMKLDSVLSSVVLPEPVPPLMITFSRALIVPSSSMTISGVKAPNRSRSSSDNVVSRTT